MAVLEQNGLAVALVAPFAILCQYRQRVSLLRGLFCDFAAPIVWMLFFVAGHEHVVKGVDVLVSRSIVMGPDNISAERSRVVDIKQSLVHDLLLGFSLGFLFSSRWRWPCFV